MNDLEKFFNAYDEKDGSRLIHKWDHYFEIYDRHFSRFRGQPINIVEFGVSQGGSIQMWQDYFGLAAQIFGIDINPNCQRFASDKVKIFIGDQGDRAFLKSLAEQLPSIDILIDDGGHTMAQQIATYEMLFAKVAPNGVYLCEDVHTSYWRRFGGGYRRKSSFIEYSKNFVDKINAWHSKSPRLVVDDFTRSAHSVHFYDSVVVVEKRAMQPPTHRRVGKQLFPDYEAPRVGAVGWLQDKARKLRGK